MKVTLTLPIVQSIKKELGNIFPKVKSSHRVEAMARGFGYSSNAALRDAFEDDSDQTRVNIFEVDFRDYLVERGFTEQITDPDEQCLTAAVIKASHLKDHYELELILDRDLYLVSSGYAKSKNYDRPEAQIHCEQMYMLRPHGVLQFMAAKQYFLDLLMEVGSRAELEGEKGILEERIEALIEDASVRFVSKGEPITFTPGAMIAAATSQELDLTRIVPPALRQLSEPWDFSSFIGDEMPPPAPSPYETHEQVSEDKVLHASETDPGKHMKVQRSPEDTWETFLVKQEGFQLSPQDAKAKLRMYNSMMVDIQAATGKKLVHGEHSRLKILTEILIDVSTIEKRYRPRDHYRTFSFFHDVCSIDGLINLYQRTRYDKNSFFPRALTEKFGAFMLEIPGMNCEAFIFGHDMTDKITPEALAFHAPVEKAIKGGFERFLNPPPANL